MNITTFCIKFSYYYEYYNILYQVLIYYYQVLIYYYGHYY